MYEVKHCRNNIIIIQKFQNTKQHRACHLFPTNLYFPFPPSLLVLILFLLLSDFSFLSYTLILLYYIKTMPLQIQQIHQIAIYCDLEAFATNFSQWRQKYIPYFLIVLTRIDLFFPSISTDEQSTKYKVIINCHITSSSGRKISCGHGP